MSRLNSLGRICQKLNLNKIFRVWVLSTDEEYYKIQFTVKESKTVLFESVVLLTWKKYRPRDIDDAYPFSPYFDEGKRNMHIMYIRRLDSYAGQCENISKEHNIKPHLCVCKTEVLD